MKNQTKYRPIMILILTAIICGAALRQPVQAKNLSMYRRCVNANSRTGWCIVVNKSTHVTAVYKKSGKKWQQYASFTCTVGRKRRGKSTTASGTFSVGNKYFVKDFRNGTAYYCTSMGRGSSGYLHTVLYERSRNINTAKIIDGRLGADASAGCVRLSRWNAYFIYRYVPKGTKIVIF